MKKKFSVLILIFSFSLFITACKSNKLVEVNLVNQKEKGGEVAFLITHTDTVLMNLDHKTVNRPFTNKPIRYQLNAGEHELKLKFYTLWKSDTGENVLLKSQKVSLEINLSPNNTYEIKHKPLNNYDEAQAFEQKPEFFIKKVFMAK